jgi:DNA-binding MarR family transcriptional regulator
VSRKAFDLAVTDFGQAIGLLVRRARAASATEELSWTETAVLKCLAKQGPQTTADLARAQGMRPQSMRTIVATLEQMRMVGRKPHPTDGRQVYIDLTAKGSAAQKSARDAKRSWLADAVSQLDHREQKTLFKATALIKRLAEK